MDSNVQKGTLVNNYGVWTLLQEKELRTQAQDLQQAQVVMYVLPALIGAGGLALSAGANLYAQRNSRRLYNAYKQDYQRWDRDFRRNTGRSPKYPMLSAYGSAMAQQNNYDNSFASSIGTLAGTVGAGSAIYGKSFGKAMKTGLRKYLG